MKDAHIMLQGAYTLETLQPYIDQACLVGLDEITILEPTYKFRECATLYREACLLYSYQKEWFEHVCTHSIVEYQTFIIELRKMEFPIQLHFGLEVGYFPEQEAFIKQMKEAFAYDAVVGVIHFVDHIAFAWPKHSKEMLWDKYHAGFIYRRYYETMNAMITSQLFDGVACFDSIKSLQVKCPFSLKHTYRKMAGLLAKYQMYVENDSSLTYRYHHPDQGISPIFLDICKEQNVEVAHASVALYPKEVGLCFER